ncbi:MAG: 50S ribosomal protein L23 [Pseudomonadota bacterium]
MKKQERLLKIILAPHMSEKAAIGAEKRREYVFEVMSDATKPEVKAAVELLFKTKVQSVRVLNVKTKPRRFGQVLGRSKAWRKAYVTLQEGQEISFAGGQ